LTRGPISSDPAYIRSFAQTASELSLFSLSGTVIHGNHLGSTLGYPTANLDLDLWSVPADSIGVYAVTATYAGRILGGMANIGYRPTISENGFTVEVYFFDFTGDLYGQMITVSFIEWLRDEVKFDSLEELTAQMGQDELRARKILSGLL
jgi:riboflavin kinase / FMN adenylyltransferase